MCPPLFVANIVINELNLSSFPQSESNPHIGQWGPWAATALVLIGALISEYHYELKEQVKKMANQGRWRIGHGIPGVKRHKKLEQDSEAVVTTGTMDEAHRLNTSSRHGLVELIAFYSNAFRETIKLFLNALKNIMEKQIIKPIDGALKSVKTEYQHTMIFWSD